MILVKPPAVDSSQEIYLLPTVLTTAALLFEEVDDVTLRQTESSSDNIAVCFLLVCAALNVAQDLVQTTTFK